MTRTESSRESLPGLPVLETLISPSAPDADFFLVGTRPLRHLDIDSGYDHQDFIANLARSSCFPRLAYFGFGEYYQTYMPDFASQVTPFADYRELFASPAFAPVGAFRWKNPACSAEELDEIRGRNTGRQVLIVRWSAEYLR